MNPGNSEPRPVAGESSLQSSRRANKRRRHDQNGRGDERDGPKWPQGPVTIRSFECPFCKLDPHRYAECRGYRLSRLSDVMQHISRQHRIFEVTLESGETDREQDIVFYCTRCRDLFYGIDADRKRDIHMNREIECQPANIEQSGVMLDGEFERLRIELRSHSRRNETFRWNIIWKWCFPEKPCPPSPYVEIILPRAEVELIIQNNLESARGRLQEDVRSIVEQCVDKIYNTSPAHRSSPSVLPQTPSNIMQTVSVPNYSAAIPMPSQQAFTSQPFESYMPGFGYSSGLTNAGVHATPNTFTNNSAPSPVPGFRAPANSGTNFVYSGYSTAPGYGYTHAPYIGDLNGSFESASQNDGYSNTYGNDMGPRRSQD
ncbi:hypothetical protein F25303_12233 [Fusarium sp. NRRL 25303]|nr:hypothetical protein F25303_12233 [Fusarium sp. NRRL 25303]